MKINVELDIISQSYKNYKTTMPSSSSSSSPPPSASLNNMVSDSNGRVHKMAIKRKMHRNKVLKLLAVAANKMDQASSSTVDTTNPSTTTTDPHNEFFNTGRAGRRNAMPDILGHHCSTSTADLPDQLSALSTQDSSHQLPSSSNPGPSNSSAAGSYVGSNVLNEQSASNGTNNT